MITTPKILLIDDDPVHLEVTGELLATEGYAVVAHRGAFGATEKAMDERPDLVLVDVNMPGLSGEGLVTVLRARRETQGIRIALHSSNDEDALRRAAERLRVSGFVCKGDPAELRRKVHAFLAAP